MRLRRHPGSGNQHPPRVGGALGKLEQILDRPRQAADAARNIVPLVEAERRIEAHWRERATLLEQHRDAALARVAEVEAGLQEAEALVAAAEQRLEDRSRIEQQRDAAMAQAAAAEAGLREAEARVAAAEQKLKDRPKPRMARKLAEEQRATEEARAEAERLRGERDRLHEALQATTQSAQERVEALERERDGLQARLSELEGRVQEAEQHLQEAGDEHAREHSLRRDLEARLESELAASQEALRDAERQASAVNGQSQRLEELEAGLAKARDALANERAACQRVEQRLDLLVESESDARLAREQHLAELERARADAVQRAESAERALAEASGRRETPVSITPEPSPTAAAEPVADDASAVGPPAAPQPAEEESLPAGNGDAHATDPSEGGSPARQRWWRRARLPCAVCHRPPPAMSDAELTANGWSLTAAGMLCPSCQAQGWHFPADATVPFRRIDASFSG